MQDTKDYVNPTNNIVIQPPEGVNPNDAANILLGLAENFRTSNPPVHKLALKCLYAANKTACSTDLKAYIHLSLGKYLWYYMKNSEKEAKRYLELSANGSQQVGLLLQANSVWAEICIFERNFNKSIQLLVGSLEHARNIPYQYAKLLFMLCEAYLKQEQYSTCLEVVEMGVKYFKANNDPINVCYFLLIKCLCYSIQPGLFQLELGNAVSELGVVINDIQQDPPALDDIRSFCYSIQLAFFLSAGLFKNAKSCLRQLHVSVQQASKREPIPHPHIRWLNSEMLTAVAYVLTVLTNIHFNNIERSQRYFQTSIKHFDTLRHCWKRINWPVIESTHKELAKQLEVLVYEANSTTYLLTGNPLECINNITCIFKLLQNDPCLLPDSAPQIHCILGMYATFQKQFADAETHFNLAIQSTNDQDLRLFNYLSMGMVFLYTGETFKFYEIFDKINEISANPKTARALLCFVNAFNNYLHAKVADSKQHISQTLEIAREEDMGRIQALASLLSSTLFKASDMDAINAGISWADQLGDISLKLWGNIQKLKHVTLNRGQNEIDQVNVEVENLKINLENNRQMAASSPANKFLHWTSGFPDLTNL